MRSAPVARARWLKPLLRWHWISAAIALLGLLLFAATGLTLNHAARIETTPQVHARQATLPQALRATLAPDPARRDAPLPAPLADWAAAALQADVHGRPAEWSPDEVYVALPRPGGEAWLRIARDSGAAEFEDTDRGWIAYFNDLHKGRHTGAAWRWFIDAFALACVVSALTGLAILQLHAANRPGTWPLVGLGLLVPLLIALLLIH